MSQLLGMDIYELRSNWLLLNTGFPNGAFVAPSVDAEQVVYLSIPLRRKVGWVTSAGSEESGDRLNTIRDLWSWSNRAVVKSREGGAIQNPGDGDILNRVCAAIRESLGERGPLLQG
ncbi:MAG: hypothetical protein RIS36_2304 [Pseudomonadota bacterium]|jgi:hypothetical protein